MNKPTLYLTYDGLTDPLGQSQVLPYLLGLSKKGWNISVVSFEKKDRFENGKKAVSAICKQNNIEWHPQRYHKNPPVLSTLKDISQMRKTVSRIVKLHQPKIIHCRSYLPMLVALPFQKRGIKVIFDMRGLWADERVDGNIWKIKNPLFNSIFKYFKRKEKKFFHKADAIVSLTKAAIPFIKQHNPKGEITLIPTAVDLNLFDPIKIKEDDKVKLKNKLGISNEYILGYSGSLGTWYLLKEMLVFYSALLKQNSFAKFLILSQDDPKELVEFAQRSSIPLDNIIIKKVDRTAMPLYLSIMDASVFFIQPKFSKIASSPTKLGELMAMGIPIICNDGVGDVKEIVEKYKAGIVLSKFDENEFKNAVTLVLKGDYFERDIMMKGAYEYYDLKLGVEKYDAIYTRLTNLNPSTSSGNHTSEV